MRRISRSSLAAFAIVASTLVAYVTSALPATAKTAAARFGGITYEGRPKLPTTLAVMIAGGAPAGFKTLTLIGVLGGANANVELVKLTQHFGAADVKQSITTFDFVIADATQMFKTAGIVLPARPAPDPQDGRALAAALHGAGMRASTGRYDFESMLDALLSHRIHVRIVNDIRAKYGRVANATMNGVMQQLINDLWSASESE